jgi:hypothetical protein
MAFAIAALPLTKPTTKSINDTAAAAATLMLRLSEEDAQAATVATLPQNIVPVFDDITSVDNDKPSVKDIPYVTSGEDGEPCDYDKEYEQ